MVQWEKLIFPELWRFDSYKNSYSRLIGAYLLYENIRYQFIFVFNDRFHSNLIDFNKHYCFFLLVNPSTETKPEESSHNSNQIPRSHDIRDQPSTSMAAISFSNQNMDGALLSDDDESVFEMANRKNKNGKFFGYIKKLHVESFNLLNLIHDIYFNRYFNLNWWFNEPSCKIWSITSRLGTRQIWTNRFHFSENKIRWYDFQISISSTNSCRLFKSISER